MTLYGCPDMRAFNTLRGWARLSLSRARAIWWPALQRLPHLWWPARSPAALSPPPWPSGRGEGEAVSPRPPPPGYCGKVYPRKEHAEEASPPATPASTTLPANPTLLRRGVETGILAQRHRDVDRDLVQLATTAAASRGSERRNTSPRRRRRHKRQCPPVPADGDGRTGTRRLAGVEGGGRRAACGIRRDMRHDIAELRRDLLRADGATASVCSTCCSPRESTSACARWPKPRPRTGSGN